MEPSLPFLLSIVTSFGSPRRQLLLATTSTLSLVDVRTRISPFRLRTRIHEPCGTDSLSLNASRSVWRDCAVATTGVRNSVAKSRPFAALRATTGRALRATTGRALRAISLDRKDMLIGSSSLTGDAGG